MARTNTKFPFDEVDDFQLQELIYEGPHTLAFRGHQSNLNRPVLIKLLKPIVKAQNEWIERFQREARVCAQLKHPNIVSVYKLGEKDSYHYIVLEFVEGISLKELLSQTGPLALTASLTIADQILEALTYVHKHKIIHRDIKPGNILLDTHGTTKLTDFGLAHLGVEVSVTQQGSIIGTPAYMAPEQIVGEAVDGRTDLFSLGTVIYEMLTGKQAFWGENYSACLHKIINEEPPPPSDINSRLSGDVDSFLEKFLKKNPSERWSDGQQAQNGLHLFTDQNKIKLERISIRELIQPLAAASSNKEGQLPVSTQKSQNGRGWLKDNFAKRWKPISGLAILIILFLATFFWMVRPDESPPITAEKQTNSPITYSDSKQTDLQPTALSDSIIPSQKEAQTDTMENDKNIDQSAHKQNSSQDQQNERMEDTLLTEHTIPEAGQLSDPGNDPMAQLNIWVEPWARIMIDGQAVDSQANQKSLPLMPGKHTLTFLHPNFSPYAMPIEIEPGEEKTVRWSFLRNAGFLWIEVRPWAEIYIDNQYRDSTPLEDLIVLSSGEHFLELKHPQLPSYREYITIEQKDTLRLQIVLKNE